MTTQEGNKLIAEFMGLSTQKVWADCVIIMEDGREVGGYIDPYFSYDYSWNDLMPVVKKIHEINTIGIAMHYEIDRQWNTVISFIEWYNISQK